MMRLMQDDLDDEKLESGIRINRFLAEAGVCSRRDADELLFSRQVTVNGTVVETLAFRVLPSKDVVKVSGRRVELPTHFVYLLLNKPEGVISTVDDPQKRTTVVEMLHGVKARVFPVGRLDYNTSGVLLLTNDGELALRLTHPRYEFPKTYHAKVEGVPTPGALYKLATGVRIPSWSGRFEKSLPARIHLVKRFQKNALIELTLREGRQHQVRKMCAAIGHPVIKLTRIKFGFLSAVGLPLGTWRYLAPAEVKRLKEYEAPAPAPDRRVKSNPEAESPRARRKNRRPQRKQ
jgi:23S rRNA pseudouridine2605 synthase